MRNIYTIISAALLIGQSQNIASAQFPAAELYRVFPAGGQINATTEVRVGGENLDGPQALIFSHPGIVATPRQRGGSEFEPSPGPEPDVFDVTVAASVSPGIYECRLAGYFGVSNPRAFVVDDRKQVLEQEPNDQVGQAFAAPVEGVVFGKANYQGDVDYYQFSAARGQRLTLIVDAQKLDSRMKPSLTVLTPSGKEISANPFLRKDAELFLEAQEEGVYIVRVHDVSFAGSDDHAYRLTVTQRPYVKSVFPPVAPLREAQEYTLVGFNLPGGLPADSGPEQFVKQTFRFAEFAPITTGIPLPDMAQAAAEIGRTSFRLTSSFGDSNLLSLPIAQEPVVVESESSPAQPQVLPGYCEAAGRFDADEDHDHYVVHATAGQALWIDVVCERGGAVADPRIRIGKRSVSAEGAAVFQQLAEADDVDLTVFPELRTMSHDPSMRFNAPEEADYEIIVSNRSSLLGDRPAYRLRVRPAAPDFQLAVAHIPENTANRDANYESRVRQCVLRPGGRSVLQVIAHRSSDFSGPIELRVQGLPPGVTASNLWIPAAARSASIVLSATEDVDSWTGAIQVYGSASIVNNASRQVLTRQAWSTSLLWPTRPFNGEFPAPETRVASDVYLSVAADAPAPFDIQVEHRPQWRLAPGAKVSIPFKVKRRNGYTGPVNVSALAPPDKFQISSVAVAENVDSGALEITAAADAPVQDVNIQLVGVVDAASYRRNVPAEARAQIRHQMLTAKLSEQQNALAAAKQEKESKTAELAQSEQEIVGLRTAQQGMEGSMTAMSEQVNAAKTAMEQARAALAAAEQTLKAVEAKAAEEQAKLQDLAGKLQAAEQKKALAAEQQAALAMKETAAQATLDRLTNVQKEAAAALEAATKAAAPANIKVTMLTAVLPIQVTAFPASVQMDALPLLLHPGETREWKLTVTREFAFAGEIKLALEGLPSGVQTETAALGADKQEAIIKWVAHADAAPVESTAVLKLTCEFNGGPREFSLSVPIRIVHR